MKSANIRAVVFGIVVAASSTVAAEEQALRLYAAGSLRGAMSEVAQAFTAAGGPPVSATFGASGLLRERIEKGETVDVFASADLGNPQALALAGRARPPIVFTRNRLCAIVAPGVDATSETLLDRMLDPKVRLGTSTPKADPGGDYAWKLFERAGSIRPGAYAALDAKALKLTGGPDSPPPPANRSVYSALIAERKADIFLTYCTNALVAIREVEGARMIPIGEPLAVGADYGLTTTKDAAPAATRFVEYVLSDQGQAILARHGFTPVAER
jgi:ABC-type molybdate transport system substrate-binding protein